MGYGTSLGTAHEDEMSYVLERGMTDNSEKQRNDTIEINQNSRSGDFQSRFYATDASTMPLEASRKLTDALKSYGGSQTPEKVPETNFIDKLLGTNGAERYQLWPEKLARSAFTLPGDVLFGKVEPGSIQEIERAADLAGLMVMGPAPVAAKLADGSLGSFAGVKSKSLSRDKLYEAQNMELDAMHPDDIWTKTGFFRGADRRWRYEIPDKDATLKMDAFDHTITFGKDAESYIVPKKAPEYSLTDNFDAWIKGEDKFKPLTLDKVIDHPELFKAYPELSTMKVEPLPEHLKASGVKGQVTGNTIYLAEGHPEYIKSVLLHEIQHGIQRHESFAFGGTSEQFLPKELPQAEKEFLSIKQSEEPKIAEALKGNLKDVAAAKQVINAEQEGWLSDPTFKEAKVQLNRLKEKFPEVYRKLSNIVESERLLDQAKVEAFTKYRNLMGEVEARNVQARADFSDFMRKYSPPDTTEDTLRSSQYNPK